MERDGSVILIFKMRKLRYSRLEELVKTTKFVGGVVICKPFHHRSEPAGLILPLQYSY